MSFALGAQSTFYYNSNQAYGKLDPWASQYLYGGNGDGTLFYPGHAGQLGLASGQPLASICLKALRQGQHDVEYLKWASQAKLSTNVNALLPDQFNWSRSNTAYDSVRQQIGDALGQ